MPVETMRAAYIEQFGPPSAIQVGQFPTPRLTQGDVLVAVETVAANPVDTYIRSGRYQTSVPFPFIIGRDLVGTVVETGALIEAVPVIECGATA